MASLSPSADRPDHDTNAQAAALTLPTYGDLLAEIEQAADLARSRRESWRRLADVVRDLTPTGSRDARSGDAAAEQHGASEHHGAAELDVLTGRRWSLEYVKIAGYRGVGGQPLEFSVSPLPGITVLHGLNGAGKSSISSGLDAGLCGAAGGLGAADGSGLLWEPVHHERDADSSHVEVVLAHADERLRLTWTKRRDDPLAQHTMTWRRGDEQRQVVPGPQWRAALAAHQPVFAYADCERRVQSGRDLREYLENLLALGGCFAMLKEAVEHRGARFADAAERCRRAWQDAAAELARIDAEHRRDESSDLPPVAAPRFDEDVDLWLKREGLTDPGDALPHVAAGQLGQVRAVAERVLAATSALAHAHAHATKGSVHQRLAAPLVALLTSAAALDEPTDVCPVCDSAGVDWRSVLDTNTRFDTSLRGQQNRVVSVLADLRDTARQLNNLTEVLSATTDERCPDAAARCDGLLARFESAVRACGLDVHPAVVQAAVDLADWLTGEQAGTAHEIAVEHSGRERRWRAARGGAVAGFVGVWREHGDAARLAGPWKDVSDRVADLRDRLRRPRQSVLGEKVSRRVQELLNDVGLRVEELDVGKRSATVRVFDAAGRHVELGMLSAGQRNALLLAPLLATADTGPFGFLVLDDPVHAFDGVRVDRLAWLINNLAADRRIVVLTHDRRLVEHLLAFGGASAEAFTVARDPRSAQVTVTSTDATWLCLIKDARAVVEGSVVIPGSTTLPTTDLVRGLCRQALDHAVSVFVIRNAGRAGRDVAADVSALDAQQRTRQRLDLAKRLYPRPGPGGSDGRPYGRHADDDVSGASHPIEVARRLCGPYLSGWDRAVHGNEAITEATKQEVKREINAADKACRALVGSGP